MDMEPSRVKDGWYQTKIIVEQRKFDGLETDGPVKVTVGAIAKPSPIDGKYQQKKLELESNISMEVPASESSPSCDVYSSIDDINSK